MGTNYYSVTKRYRDLDKRYRDLESRQDTRLRYETLGTQEKLHIGKCSGGWHFGLHVIPEIGICDIEGWVPYLLSSDRVIVDEYGEELTYEELISVITQRGRKEPNDWSNEMLHRNFAELGLNNLVRRKIGSGCVQQGQGTWDCISGNFS